MPDTLSLEFLTFYITSRTAGLLLRPPFGTPTAAITEPITHPLLKDTTISNTQTDAPLIED